MSSNVYSQRLYTPCFIPMGSLPEGGLGSSALPVTEPKLSSELYGKQREFANVVMLEREIGFRQCNSQRISSNVFIV
ncbi:hypothetical protein L1887_35339 [Cichorium endivia]|nr:hypothetical protein L1887_35339 [Cichorium endivia]